MASDTKVSPMAWCSRPSREVRCAVPTSAGAPGSRRGERSASMGHTAVALAIEPGAHPRALMERLGHSSINVTLDRYGHLFPGQDEAIADQ